MQGLDVGRSLYFPTLQVYPVHKTALGLKGQEDKEQKRSDLQLIYAAVIPVVARGLLLIFVHIKKASPLSVLHTAQLKHREDVWVVFHRIHRRVEETQNVRGRNTSTLTLCSMGTHGWTTSGAAGPSS